MSKEEHKKPKHDTHHNGHRKVFDVTRPGKAPASPNSRSVIVSQKPPVADDQFVPSAPPLRASDPYAKHDLMDPKKRKDLQPLGTPSADQADATPETPAPSMFDGGAPALPDATKTATPEVSESVPVSVATPAPNASQETSTPSTAPNLDNAATPAPAEETPTSSSAAPTQPVVTSVDDVATALAADTEADAATPITPVSEETNTPAPVPAEEETPAHLAMEQTVAATPADTNANTNSGDKKVPIWEHPDTSEQVEGSVHTTNTGDKGKSIEDLLAETGAPVLEPEQSPALIVSHHKGHKHIKWWEPVLIFLLIIIVAAIAFDLLLDAGVIKTSLDLPYTDFLN